MPIEFRCGQCNQLLRVPDDSAGKNARCPKCQALMTVPAASGEAPSSAAPPVGSAMPGAATDPFYFNAAGGGGAPGMPPPPPPPANPYSEAAGGSPFGGGGPTPSLNPYSSPMSAAMQPMAYPSQSLPINPQPVQADVVFNYAWEIWKTNLGLLIGVTVVIMAASYVIAIPFQALQVVFDQRGEKEVAVASALVGQLLNNLVQMFLGIGAVQINLKLARRQPASFGDLFGGGALFLPVLGGWIVAFIPLAIGLVLLIVPGVLMMLAFWPFYYLIVDRKAGVIESFSVASRITTGNWGSAFVLWLMSFGITILGCLALCVGLLFAAPLISMMWAVAYLMMSGQLPPQLMYGKYVASYPAPVK
jgi:hypothetical protein